MNRPESQCRTPKSALHGSGTRRFHPSSFITIRMRIGFFTCLSLLPNLRGDEPIPHDVQSLVDKRIEAIARIDATYLGELEKLKGKYTKLGDLENANRINGIIISMRSVGLIGRWSYPKNGEEYWFELLENGDARHKSNLRGKWRVSGSTLYIDWDTGVRSSLGLPPKNGVLTEVDAKQGAGVYKKVR